MDLSAAFSWVMAHKVEIMEALGGLWVLLSVIVRLTPSPKDDAALSKIRDVAERVSFLAPGDTDSVVSLPGADPRGSDRV